MKETVEMDVEYLRSWIGRKEVVSDFVSIDLVRKFNATLDLGERLPVVGDTAPHLIQYCLAQPAIQAHLLGNDGHPQKGGFLPPVPLPRRMWAGSNLVFHGHILVGDLVRRVSHIADVVIKEGRTGVLCFVTVEHKVDVAGKLLIEETQNIVYREAAMPQDPSKVAESEPAPTGQHQRDVVVSPTLLFRYSALTFNGHRIHYDRPYATEIEQYPGLVLHGPLQATLLLNYAAELKGGVPTKFMFRGQSPLFDDDKVSLHATEDNGRMKLWTAREDGPIGMSAEADWP
ncbi:3-methylfumaryl-CoA hydratase [Rhizobium sp. PP-F2F-G48]|uniref:FAS1-like dehydratase domain-containing protein n=1 Tax=Rhizobium sp. PP-F2F-G48 TaxID=2135651 RepID=UPI001053B7A3|nr:MaoC family dehydratase N-terminal domain-containing protein [Rhizobium sp. PP-F2F-G48]TCM46507.1 3-methylfumaryl-CoA hydratase [Rhizobium sp. PP-F2F-G48]